MTAIDANGQELQVGHLVRRITVEPKEDARRWGGGGSGEYLGVVEHITGHAVATEKGVYCGRLVVRT